jgi:hypothetical protein
MKTLISILILTLMLSCSTTKKYHKPPRCHTPKCSIIFTKIDTTYWNGTDSITFTKEIIIDYTLDLRTY